MIRNVGAATLTGPTVTLTPNTPGLRVVGATSVQLSSLASFATTTATFQVILDEQQTAPSSISLTIGASDASSALVATSRTITAPANLDVAPAASSSDDFTTPSLVWTVSSGWALHQTDTASTASVQVAANGDHTLVTPALQATAGQHLVVTFSHRYQLSPLADGGVLEVSTDGTNFVDASTVGTPNYDATLTAAGNPLTGRPAWTGTNPNFPAFDSEQIDLGTSFGGQTVFLRFRASGDPVADASTWDIDLVHVDGITNTPFPVLVPETGDCLPGHRPVADAGTAFTVATGAAGALDGSQSSDADGDALTFEWQQLSGVAVTLSSTSTAQPTFTAPATAVDRFVVFQLLVVDATNRISLPSTVTLKVLGSAAPDGPPVDAAVPDGLMFIDAAVPVDGAVVTPDAAPKPDAGNPDLGGGGGCGCSTDVDARGGLLLVAGVALVLRRRRRRVPS